LHNEYNDSSVFSIDSYDEKKVAEERDRVASRRFLSGLYLQHTYRNEPKYQDIVKHKDIRPYKDYDERDKKLSYCYLCSIGAHVHEKTKPVPESKRRYLIKYENPLEKAHKQEIQQYDLEYVFKVKTGQNKYAGTDAQVWFKITGDNGIWPRTELIRDYSPKEIRFPVDSELTFNLLGPVIGDLNVLKIWHNSHQAKNGWFLEHVEITCEKLNRAWRFNCGHWISKYRPPLFKQVAVIKRAAHEEENPHKTPKEQSSYFILIKTASSLFSGTDANVKLKIQFENDTTDSLLLKSEHVDTFEKHQLDVFFLESSVDLGAPVNIRMTHDATKLASDWKLEYVKIVYSKEPNKFFLFPFEKWLSNNNQCTFKSSVVDKTPVEATTQNESGNLVYHLTVITGDKKYAGTDANVYLQIRGTSGAQTLPQRLQNNNKNKFERKQQDNFNFIDSDVGEISSVRIWHDNGGVAPGWYLQTVLLKVSKTILTDEKYKEFSTIKDEMDKIRYKVNKKKKLEKNRIKTSNMKRPLSANARSVKNKESEKRERSSSAVDLKSKSLSEVNVSAILRKRLEEQSNEINRASPTSILKTSSSPRNNARNVKFDTEKKEEKKSLVNHFWAFTVNYDEKNFVKKTHSIDEYDQSLLEIEYKKVAEVKQQVDKSDERRKSLEDTRKQKQLEKNLYVFECNKWLAKNEDDGKTERILKITNIIN